MKHKRIPVWLFVIAAAADAAHQAALEKHLVSLWPGANDNLLQWQLRALEAEKR